MITNLWLKSQPKKKISYPDCIPLIYNTKGSIWITNTLEYKTDMMQNKIEANYTLESINRIEFKP